MKPRLLVAILAAGVLPPPAVVHPSPVTVDPPFADRLFPYVRQGDAWAGTPAHRPDVTLPAVSIIVDRNAAPEILAEAAALAFQLGLRVEEGDREGDLVVFSDAWTPGEGKRAVVIGNGLLPREAGVAFEGPSILRRSVRGADLLFVGGGSDAGTAVALRYLARTRLPFQTGAYGTFFHFVILRAYLEEGNWTAADEVIASPAGIAACGRNLQIAAPMMASFPEESKEIVRRRNRVLYGELPGAVAAKDAGRSIALWKEAMETCYACHQGAGGAPVLRRFAPLESNHAPHRRIAERLLPGRGCEFCHEGKTEVRGYESAGDR